MAHFSKERSRWSPPRREKGKTLVGRLEEGKRRSPIGISCPRKRTIASEPGRERGKAKLYVGGTRVVRTGVFHLSGEKENFLAHRRRGKKK